MNELGLIFAFSLVGGVFSLVGALILLGRPRLTERLLIHLVTFSAGALLGAAFLNILPEALGEGASEERLNELLLTVLAGVVGFFIIERALLRFHQHDNGHTRSAPVLLVLGDSIHNFFDGVAITTAFLVSVPFGIVTALAVAAHEIPSEIGEFSVMLQAGWQRKRVLMLNVVSAMMATVGALVAYWNRDVVEQFAAPLLALTAGIFIYISLSDLIPEIHHKTRRDKAWHVVVLLIAGVVAVRAASVIVEQFVPGGI